VGKTEVILSIRSRANVFSGELLAKFLGLTQSSLNLAAMLSGPVHAAELEELFSGRSSGRSTGHGSHESSTEGADNLAPWPNKRAECTSGLESHHSSAEGSIPPS